MPEIVLSVEVALPAEELWAAVTDWPAQGEWMLGTTVRGTALDGHGLGGGIEGFTGIGTIGFLDTMTITRWDPPHRCEVRHEGWLVRGSAVFEVVAVDDARSRFIWAEWLVPPLGIVGAIGFAVARPLIVAGVSLSLRRLASWAPEHRSAVAAAAAST